MLDHITPVILTCNEEANIGRTLAKLAWAREIIVVDSCSTDSTLFIMAGFPQVHVVQRPFVSHADQFNFALRETGLSTEWVLALDADYVLTYELVEELRQLRPEPWVNGYTAGFIYCINGAPLRGTVYPPVTVLYRREHAVYRQDGHAHRVSVKGHVAELKSRIHHDDRKPLGRWVQSQNGYMRLEARKLLATPWRSLGWPDRLRRLLFITPLAMPLYCLIIRRNLLDGLPGVFYAFQRMFAEVLLSLYLMEYKRSSLPQGSDGPGNAAEGQEHQSPSRKALSGRPGGSAWRGSGSTPTS